MKWQKSGSLLRDYLAINWTTSGQTIKSCYVKPGICFNCHLSPLIVFFRVSGTRLSVGGRRGYAVCGDRRRLGRGGKHTASEGWGNELDSNLNLMRRSSGANLGSSDASNPETLSLVPRAGERRPVRQARGKGGAKHEAHLFSRAPTS